MNIANNHMFGMINQKHAKCRTDLGCRLALVIIVYVYESCTDDYIAITVLHLCGGRKIRAALLKLMIFVNFFDFPIGTSLPKSMTFG